MTRDTIFRDSGVAWLGQLPGHWNVRKLKFQVEFTSVKVSEPPAGTRYVGLEHIESMTGKFMPVTDSMQTESESTVNAFKKGDVLFGKLRPYLAKAAVADTDGYCSSEILVLRPQSLLGDYLKRAMLLDGFIQTVDASTYGSKMPRADATFISQLMLPEPPLNEQIDIAAYLDAETARIDGLISAKKKLRLTLEAFAKSTFLAELLDLAKQPPGIYLERLSWLPQIPSTWVRCKVKHLVEHFDQGVSPQCESHPPGENEWGVLKAGCINSGSFNPLESKALPPEIPSLEDVTVCEGDLIISRANTKDLVGRCAVAQMNYTKLMLSDKLYRLKLDKTRCVPEFIRRTLWVPAVRQKIEESASGASPSMLNIDRRTILEIEVVLPPVADQMRLLQQVDERALAISELMVHVEKEIGLLIELRASTITDAILGRIDFRKTKNKQESSGRTE